MSTPFARGGRSLAAGFLALSLLFSAFSATFLVPAGVALAEEGVAIGDTLILDGPGGQYGILTVAPAGSALSVDGEPIDGYYPVSYNGVGGWTAVGLVEVIGGGNGGGGNRDGDGGGGGGHKGKTREMGNGGVETVSADPVYADSGIPAEAAPAAPVTGGSYGPGGGGYSQEQVIDIIHEAALNYGQSPDDMVRVARCESGLDPYAVGGGGAYFGLFQFVPSTFANTPYGQYEITDAWANANAAAWMWAEGHKSSWVCQ
jgi:hypothetical protein